MNGRILYVYFFVWLCSFGLAPSGWAQTITATSVNSTSVCPGGAVTVMFSTSGTFGASNTFTAQLSDPTGAFSTTTAIGSATSGTVVAATIPAGAVAGSYKIRVVASNPATVGPASTQTVTVSTPGKPAVTNPAAYCVGIDAAVLSATASVGGALNWYGPNATGGTASAVAPKPGTSAAGTTSYYVSQTVNGCESARSEIIVTVKASPPGPVASPVTFCVGQTASPLTAGVNSGGVLNWYGTSQTGGTASATAPTPPTTASGVTTYYVSQTVDGCEGPRSSLAVTVNPIPAAPLATSPNPYCKDSPATALTATGQNLTWYTSATGVTGTNAAIIPLTNTAGTQTYYVSQKVNGCESPRFGIPVVVKELPSAPATAAVSFCQGTSSPMLSATALTGGTLNWYGTNQLGGSGSATPPAVQNTNAGTFTYYVSQTVDGCESPRAGLVVTVRATPALPNVSSITACQNQSSSVTLSATPATGGTLNWYGTSQTGGTPSPTAPAPSLTAVGATTYYVSQTVNGCEGGRAALSVTVNPVPAAPTATAPGPYCRNTTPAALTATGTNLTWYTSATGGSGDKTAIPPSTSTAGSTTYYVTQTVSGCESPRQAITVVVKELPVAPSVSSVEFCQSATVPVLTASASTGGTLSWYGTNQTGGTASSTAPTVSAATAGSVTYYVSQTVDGCESSRVGLAVRVKATPAVPATSSVSYCNNAQTQSLQASGSSLKWYDGSGTLLPAAPTPPSSSVGTQTFQVTQTVDGCESARASLVVTINPIPTQPAVTNISYCQASTDQPVQAVQPLTANGTNLRWYIANDATTAAPTPVISQTGVQSYQVTQTVNSCESEKATIQVTINTTPAPIASKTLYNYCIGDQATPLEATATAGATLQWIDPYNRLYTNAPVPATTNANVDAFGDPFYVYQIGSNGCYSPRTTIRVVVNTTPSLALVAPTSSVNLGESAQIRLQFTGSAPYSYTLTEGYSGVSRASDTTISVLPRANTTYQILAVRNGCGTGAPGNPATATITVRVPTISTSALASTTLCTGLTLSVPFASTGQFNAGNAFRVELASVSDTTKKYTIQSTSTGSPISVTLPNTVPGGQYQVRAVASNPSIPIVGTNSPTQLTVRGLPTAALTGNQTIYEGSPANLTITFGGDGPWTINYADSLQTYSATATTNPYIAEARPARRSTYRLTSVANVCGTGTTSGTALVTVLPLLGIEDTSLDPVVKAYPVPTSAIVTVELDLLLTREPAVLSITTLGGQPIQRQVTRNRRNELDMSGQPGGTYLLRIQVGERQTVRKVVKL
ncbi:T9SS type A sorting domain-containing protein [Spirosoma sp. KUDC1026]|uniref:Ig-like domain-containing protein n=1 Tax=Spirosoma sp. KUDC1026 TaxID=2745947 RepID=UPI00159BB16A|nr:T9SS type A sorting domain-containing protein [Spirosoma sp. KUDC1026]QKZ11892.1 T9SS type A sorting domain-containing protein [Spirosoma sp. KUDC1026]